MIKEGYKMAVIAMSREYGSEAPSLSKPFAAKVAKELDYVVVDKELIEKVLMQYGMINLDDVLEKPMTLWGRFDENLRRTVVHLNNIILAFAKRGNCVVLGRGAFVSLCKFSDVISVRIKAPFNQRVNNVANFKSISQSQAEELVMSKDKARESFYKTFHRVDVYDTNWFDLVVDTGKISSEMACNWMIEAVREIDKKEADPGNSTKHIEVDLVLADCIEQVVSNM